MNQDLLQDIVRQVLGEMKLESEAVNNVYEYGIFADMNEAINESEKAQKKLLEYSVEQRNDFANAIRKEILKKNFYNKYSELEKCFSSAKKSGFF